MFKLFAFTLIVAGTVGSTAALAVPLNPQALFKRCFAHVTGTVPSYEMWQRLQTKFKTVTGVATQRTYVLDLCLELLNNTVIQSDGMLAGPKTGSFFTDAEQTELFQKTYLNFTRIHSSWFNKSVYVMRDDVRATSYSLDRGAPALYWNAAAFIPSTRVSSVVTSTQFYRPIRTSPIFYNSSIDYIKSFNIGEDFELAAYHKLLPGNVTDFNGTTERESERAPFVKRMGSTVGLETVSPNMANASFQSLTHRDALHNFVDLNSDADLPEYQVTAYLTKTAGGGVLGSPPYMMMNLPTYISAQDGGLKVARDWATSVLSDFLCKQTPTLRYSDGSAAIQKNVTPQSPPFRSQASCMACHASMDPLAYSIRNFQIGGIYSLRDNRISTIRETPGAWSDFLAEWPNSGRVISSLVDKDTNFHKSKPTGELLFRSFDGTKVSTPINNGLPDVGTAIAGTRDYYACVVSRYYKYLSGKEVNLNDPVVSGMQFDATKLAEKNWVVRTGDQFKGGDQSIKTLWRTLLKSDWYQDALYSGAK